MFRVYPSSAFVPHFFMLLQHGVRQTDDVLALPMSEQLQRRASKMDDGIKISHLKG